MATSKKESTKARRADAPKATRNAAAKGINGFDDKAVADRIIAAHKASVSEATAREAKADAAYAVCGIAVTLRHSDDNKTLDDGAFQSAWRYSMRGIYDRLLAAGVSWVERTETKLKDGTVQVGAKLTSYGQNISSTAQNAATLLTVDEVVEAGSYSEVRKQVKAKRDELAAAELTDEQRECAELAEQLDTGYGILSKLLHDAESADAYRAALEKMAEMVKANTPIGEDTEDGEVEAKAA